MLMLRVAEPVDTRIISDSVMGRINQDNLVELVRRVLAYPVGVEDTESTADVAANPFLSNASEAASRLLLPYTLVLRFAVDDSLGNSLLPITTANPHSVDNVALLRLVSKSAGFVWPSGSLASVDGWQVAILPRPYAHKETQHIRLLLLP